MLADAFSDAVMALSRFKEAFKAMETELVETQKACQELERRAARLEERLREIEDRGIDESDLKDRIDMLLQTNTFDSLIEDKIRDMLEDRVEDAVESALSGREVEVNISGTMTL